METRQKQWRLRNLERARAIGRACYHRNREKNVIKMKLDRELHPEREKAKQERFRKKHRERINMEKRERRKANARKEFERKLCWTYGSNAGKEWHRLLNEQVGLCKLCNGQNLKGKRKGLVIDHCHETKQIRGLLCDKCNQALGLLGDNAEGLKRALDYVS